MRQLAWLHATPKPPEGSRRAQQPQKQQLSRLEQLKKAGAVPPMPPNPAPHIFERLLEIGLTEAAGMGAVPISWREISAWCERTGIDLAPWEARLLRKLSTEYLAEGRRAEAEGCPPPWRVEVSQQEIETELDRLRMVLG